MQLGAIAAIACVRLPLDNAHQIISSEFLRQRPRLSLVDPHQWRVDYERGCGAKVQGDLKRFDGVVPAIGIAGEVGLADAGDDVLESAPIG